MATSTSSTSADVTADRIAHLADLFQADHLSLQSKNMLALIYSGKYTDVILQAGGMEFRAHKLILATNSPVFAAMFDEDDTAQAKKDRVDIDDVSADVMQEMLAFIYTGRVPRMEEFASELLSAACKFQLDILKSYCNRYLILTYQSTFPVTHLPELALLCVFKQLQLRDIMTACKVCTSWARLVPQATRRMRSLNLLVGPGDMVDFKRLITECSGRGNRFLNLLVKEDGTPMFPARPLTEWNWLQYDMLHDDAVIEITGTFTGINKLVVVVDGVQASHYLANLLDGWSAQLVSLQLVGEDFIDEEDKEDEEDSDSQVNRFYGAINRLTTLKHLNLALLCLPFRDLPILSQLEQLEFYSYKVTEDQFVEMLQRHVPVNSALARICCDCRADYLDQFTSLSEHLRNRFGQLDLYPTGNELAPFCTNFQFLTSLCLILSGITFRQLFRHLAQLQHLIHLYVDMTFSKTQVDNLADIPLPQVKSVKVLELELREMNHQVLTQMNIGWTMPNVQVIEFNFGYYYNCTDCNCECGIDEILLPSDMLRAELDLAKACFREMFRPLKRDCTKLRKIVHNWEPILGTAEELLA